MSPPIVFFMFWASDWGTHVCKFTHWAIPPASTCDNSEGHGPVYQSMWSEQFWAFTAGLLGQWARIPWFSACQVFPCSQRGMWGQKCAEELRGNFGVMWDVFRGLQGERDTWVIWSPCVFPCYKEDSKGRNWAYLDSAVVKVDWFDYKYIRK